MSENEDDEFTDNYTLPLRRYGEGLPLLLFEMLQSSPEIFVICLTVIIYKLIDHAGGFLGGPNGLIMTALITLIQTMEVIFLRLKHKFNEKIRDLKSIHMTSEVPCEVANLKWRISDFKRTVDMEDPLNLAQLTFDAGYTIGLPCKWQFILRKTEYNTVGLLLSLVESPKRAQKVFAEFDYVVRKHDGQIFLARPAKATPDMKAPKYFSYGEENAFGLLTQMNRESFAETTGSEDLCIEIKFTMFANAVINRKNKLGRAAIKIEEQSRLDALENLRKLLDSGEYADFSIKMQDGKIFKVHTAILASRSPVFFAMFKTNMVEGISGECIISDISSEAMETVLNFIYSGVLDEKWMEMPRDVIDAAEKYSLTLLKEYCDRNLIQGCDTRNALELLEIAKLYGLNTAVKDISRYIKSNIDKILLIF